MLFDLLPNRRPAVRFGRAAWVAGLLTLGWAGYAQTAPVTPTDVADMTLEELLEVRIAHVYGASKYDQKVTQAPAAVTIVTADEISKFGYRTLADILRSVRGVYVSYDRNYENFGVRGFNRAGDFNTRVLLLVDGHRLNDNLYSSAIMGTEGMVDVDLVDRVEVIRGPSSSIYGNSAFFGVINVVTRKPADIDGVEASVSAGSNSTGKTRLTYGKQFPNGVGVLLSGSFFATDGQAKLYYPEFDRPESNHGIVTNADDENAQNWLGSVAYHGLVLTGGYSYREKHIPTASYGTVFNDGRERSTEERTFADLKYEWELPGGWQALARVFYDRYGYRATYPFDYAAPGVPPFVVLNHVDNFGDGVGTEFQVTGKVSERNTLVTGAEFRKDLNLYQSSFTTDPLTYSFQSNHDASSAGLYFQDEFVINPEVRLSAGLRLDRYSNFGFTLNPRLSAIYAPAATTTFKLLYGSAYRAANAYELFLASPGYSKANPNLRPERIRTYELVFEQYLPHSLRLNISGYQYDIRDLISHDMDPADGLVEFENIDRITARGIEIELEGRYAHGLLVRGSYALQRTKDNATGRDLTNSPRHMGKFNTILPLFNERLFAGLELQYLSSLETLGGARTTGFLLANATVSTRLSRHWDLSFSVYNLGDEHYAYPGASGNLQDQIPQNGRSVRLKAGCRF